VSALASVDRFVQSAFQQRVSDDDMVPITVESASYRPSIDSFAVIRSTRVSALSSGLYHGLYGTYMVQGRSSFVRGAEGVSGTPW
jgi:predicted secreted protein